MFDHGSHQRLVLSWRGPLLAGGLFAAVFAILLLMAHENQANTSEMGSSLREDPYGTSLLFDSYGRAGYEVQRSQNEDSLSDQNALRTTAFFIGQSLEPWTGETGDRSRSRGEKFRGRVEDFLAHGGRVVLVAPAWKLKSKSQNWELETQWNQTRHESQPTWLSPHPGAMPPGSEMMFLADDAPWLKTDPAWTVLYSGPADAKAEADSSVHVYMAMRRIASGELIAASQESFLLNEAIKTRPNPMLLDFLAGGRPVVWVDEALHGLRQDEGVLWLVERYRLEGGLLLFWASLLVLLWSLSGDLVRRPTSDQNQTVIRYAEGAGVATRRLLERSIAREQVVAECWQEFCRRSPQDAEAISQDPRCGPRLREALALAPLGGYRQLSQLVRERRASARSPGRAELDRPASFPRRPQTAPEETPIT